MEGYEKPRKKRAASSRIQAGIRADGWLAALPLLVDNNSNLHHEVTRTIWRPFAEAPYRHTQDVDWSGVIITPIPVSGQETIFTTPRRCGFSRWRRLTVLSPHSIRPFRVGVASVARQRHINQSGYVLIKHVKPIQRKRGQVEHVRMPSRETIFRAVSEESRQCRWNQRRVAKYAYQMAN